jgi:hypothetical protein
MPPKSLLLQHYILPKYHLRLISATKPKFPMLSRLKHLFQRSPSFDQRVRNFTPELHITNRVLARSIWCRDGAGYLKRDSPTDTPLSSLYRLYHFIITDNTIEFFCNKADWPVNTILDPKDTNPERNAILAVLTALMCRAFNPLIEKGLPRDSSPIV